MNVKTLIPVSKIPVPKIKAFIVSHKIISAIAFVALVGAGYGIYSYITAESVTARYVLTNVRTGTITASISGTGQVAAKNQTTITSEVSGDITGILVGAGDEIKQGERIATIDARDAVKVVNNAELTLENAQISYEKAVKQAGDQATGSASSDLTKAYQDGYNAIANTSIDLPAIFTGVNDILYNPTHSPYFSDNQIAARVGGEAVVYKTKAGEAFDSAKREYDAHFNEFKNISAQSSPEEISKLLETTHTILKQLLSGITGVYNTIDYVRERLTSSTPAEITADKSALTSYVNKVNADITSITNAIDTIDESKDSGTTANLAMKSAKLAVNQATDALYDAQVALADHVIRAPYDGLIAKVIAKQGDKVTTNSSIAIIVTKEQLVNISLNEIDAAKVARGNPVKLTFDAIDDLVLPGHVTNVDLVGTVSQGVVSYNVEIAFDENDSRVKPGMTVTADIIAQEKQDVLMVPAGAVKIQGKESYVQVFEQTYDKKLGVTGIESAVPPIRKLVTTGISNDTMIEVVSGLTDDEQIVSKIITGSAVTVKATPSILSGITGGNRTRPAGSTTTVRVP